MCGRFLVPAVPQHLLRDHLPACLLVRSGKEARDRTQPPNTPAAASIAHSKAHSTASSTAPSTAGGHLARLVELMREEVKGRHPGSESVVNHLSGALFGLTLRFASENGEPPRGLLALSQRPRLQPALSAMFDQPGEPWSLPGLAALCNMSRATFARQFDEAIGRSPTDLLTEVRMAVAGRKLAQTRLPVPEIGEQVGYKSEAAFQRAFKKKVGVTPAQWRAQAKAQSAL
jgi:AraC family transcriptional activator of mtrCDE